MYYTLLHLSIRKCYLSFIYVERLVFSASGAESRHQAALFICFFRLRIVFSGLSHPDTRRTVINMAAIDFTIFLSGFQFGYLGWS